MVGSFSLISYLSKWMKQLGENAKLLLPLIEKMKSASLTSQSLTMPLPLLTIPKPRRGTRHAHHSFLNLMANQSVESFASLLALFLLLPCLFFLEVGLLIANHVRYHFSISQPKGLHSRANGNLSEFCRIFCSEESYSCVCSSLTTTTFLAAAANLSSFFATGPDKFSYLVLKYLSRCDLNLPFHIFHLSWSLHLFPSFGSLHLLFPSTRWENFSAHLLPFGLSCSPPASQSCLCASFYPSTPYFGVQFHSLSPPVRFSSWPVYFKSLSFSVHFR